jgi:hypothetical protein
MGDFYHDPDDDHKPRPPSPEWRAKQPFVDAMKHEFHATMQGICPVPTEHPHVVTVVYDWQQGIRFRCLGGHTHREVLAALVRQIEREEGEQMTK